MKSGFQWTDHTADMGLRVWADDWKSLFAMAAQGLLSLMYDIRSVRKIDRQPLILSANSTESLFLKWLKEILFWVEDRQFAIGELQIETIYISDNCNKNAAIQTELKGEGLNLIRHGFCREVKAVTRHNLFIGRKGSRLEANVLFDL